MLLFLKPTTNNSSSYLTIYFFNQPSTKLNLLICFFDVLANSHLMLDKFSLNKYLLVIPINHLVFLHCNNFIDGVYEYLEGYIPTKTRKKLIVFDEMIAYMNANKKNKPYSHWIVHERKKTQHFTCLFLSQPYLKVPSEIRSNMTHFFLWKYLTKENSNK